VVPTRSWSSGTSLAAAATPVEPSVSVAAMVAAVRNLRLRH
jgi:hypothetical protein